MILKMRNIRKSFGELEVLKDISLDVDKGEVVSVIGPSGSGKSSTWKRVGAALGFLHVDSGALYRIMT